MEITENYWQERYTSGNTGWDMGSVSPPLTGFMQNWSDKNAEILIPGAGNAYEAEWLWRMGFKNVHVIDIAEAPLQGLIKRCPGFPETHAHLGDFFEHHGQYDLILEQTFFCALNPALRKRYVDKMRASLKPGGQLAGILFDFPLTEDGPPFGGSLTEYRSLFQKAFKIYKLERCYNSIAPRLGKELFFRLIKG